jgi:hypothetical protein
MAKITVVPNGDGTSRYYDENRNQLTNEEAVAAASEPTPGIMSYLGGIASGVKNTVETGVQNVAANAPDFDPDKANADTLFGSYNAYSKVNPDQAAQMQKVADAFGLDPVSMVNTTQETQRAAQEAYQNQQAAPSSDFGTLLKQNPTTANYLSDAANMQKSHDDIPALQWIENIGKTMSNSYQLSGLEQQLGEFGQKLKGDARSVNDLTDDEREKMNDLLSRITAIRKESEVSPWSVAGVAGAISGMAPQAAEALQYIPAGMAAGVATGATTGAAVGPEGAAAGAAAGGVTGAALGFQTGFAKTFADKVSGMQYLTEQLKGVSQEKAAVGSDISGALTMALSLPVVSSWMKIPQIADKSGLLKNLGVTTVENSFIGAAMTAAELSGSKYAEDKMTSWSPEDLSNVAEGGIDMIPVSLALSTPGFAWAGLHQLGEVADSAKTTQRSPEATASLINNAVAGTPIDVVNIPAEAIANYVRDRALENPKEPKDILQTMGVSTDDLSTALATGDSVPVKLGDFEVLPKEVRDEFLPDAKVGEGPSAREMQALYEEASKARADEENAAPEEVLTPEEKTTQKTPQREEEANTGDLARDTGISDLDSYKQAVDEAKKDAPPEESPELTKEQADFLREKGDELKETVANEPLYQAEKMFDFNLQLFSAKDVKDLADKYRAGKLDVKQEAYFDSVAEKHGFSSGDELADAIQRNRLEDAEVTARLDAASRVFKNANGLDEVSKAAQAKATPELLRQSAMESAALKSAAAKQRIVQRAQKGYLSPQGQRGMQNFMAAQGKDALKYAVKSAREVAADRTRAGLEKQQEKFAKRVQELKDRYTGKMETMGEKNEQKLGYLQQKLDDVTSRLKEQTQISKDMQKIANTAMKDSADKRLARNGELRATEAKTYAKTAVASMPVSKATDYKAFLSLADKAKKAAETFYRKGDYDNATSWKDKEVTCRAMAVEAVSAYKQFTQHTRYLKSVQRIDPKTFGNQENFVQAANLLDRFGYSRADYKPTIKTENLSDWAARMQKETGTVLIDDWLYNESLRQALPDLTLNQVKSISDALKNIKTVSRQQTGLLQADARQTFVEARDSMIETLNERPEKFKPSSNRKSIANRFHNLVGELKTFDTLIGKLQGWKDDAALSDFWLSPRDKMADLESLDIRKLTDQYKKIWEPYTKRERYDMTNKKISIPELGLSTTRDKLLGVALNMGNKYNLDMVSKSKPLDLSEAKVWDEPTIRTVLQKYLSEKDWNAVQATWDMLDGMWPAIADHHRELTGFAPERVDAEPFRVTLADGSAKEIRGGYYPLKPDTRLSLMNAMDADADTALYMGSSPLFVSTKKGFLNARKGGNYAVSLDLNLMLTHMLDVTHDLHFRGLVSDYVRMSKSPEFQAAVFAHGGDAALQGFRGYIQTLAGNAYRDVGKSAFESALLWMRRNASNAAITFRLGVITQNISNALLYANAVKDFGQADAMGGLLRYGVFDLWPRTLLNWHGENKFKQDIYNRSAFMKDWDQRPEYTLWESSRDVFTLGPTSAMGKVAEFSQSLMHFSDELTALPMWKQAYSNVLKKGQTEEEAVHYADNLIRRVNGSGRAYDQSAFVRGDKTSQKIINSFMGFMNTELNRWMRESGIASQSIVNLPRFAAFVGSRLLLFTFMSNITAGHLPGDKDDPMKWYLANAASYPFQLVPIAKDIAPTIISSLSGVQTYGYRPPITFSGLQSLSDLGTSIEGYKKNTGKTTGANVAEKATKAAAYLSGYPDQLNAWFWNAYDYSQNGMRLQLGDIFSRRARAKR